MESILKVPLETLRNDLRTTQVVIEKELQTLIQQIQKQALDRAAVLVKVKKLHSRAQEIQKQTEITEKVYSSRKNYTGDQLPLLIGEYLLRSNYFKAAKQVSEALGLDQLLDFEIFSEYHRICHSILAKDSGPILQWIGANRQYLRKTGSTLEYDARRQHFIQLACSNKLEAIAYSRKHLGKFYDTHYASLSSATLSLVSSANPDGWRQLKEEFSHAFFEFYGKTSYMSLFDVVTTGLSALKTHSCSPTRPLHSRYTNQSLRDHMCPACSADLGTLAKDLPYAHLTESILDDDIVMLPNRRCYGRQVLRKLADDAGLGESQVFDPATLEVFEVDELRKAFPS